MRMRILASAVLIGACAAPRPVAVAPRPAESPQGPRPTWETLAGKLHEEDWQAAATTARALMAQSLTDTDDRQASLRYAYLLSLAGMVSRGQAAHDDLEREAQGMVGLRLVMPSHPVCGDAGGDMNCICPESTDGEVCGPNGTFVYTASATRDGTVLLFELVTLSSRFSTARPVHTAHAGGTLRSVQTNPNRTRGWVARLELDEGFVVVDEGERLAR